MPFCSNCGKEVLATDSFCWSCGSPLRARGPPVQAGVVPDLVGPGRTPEKKNLWLALFLSFLVPGLGQYYVGAKRKGEVFIAAAVVLVLLFAVGIGLYLYTLLWIYNMMDAYLTVRKAVYVPLPVRGRTPQAL